MQIKRLMTKNVHGVIACYDAGDYNVQMIMKWFAAGRDHDIRGHSGSLQHIKVKRKDGGNIFPWQDLQAIKNELCGTERVAVEVFPAESELVDNDNVRHLWVFDPTYRLPFGLDPAKKARFSWDELFGPDELPVETADRWLEH